MKILLIDVGNTLIKIAMVIDDKTICEWPVVETKDKNVKLSLKNAFKNNKDLIFNKVIISCVVPKLLILLSQLVENTYFIKPLILNCDLMKNLPLKINLENPQLGSDLIALSFGGYTKYQNTIIVSLGTATTYSIIVNSELIGVIIGPGVSESKNALIVNAALLSDFNIEYYSSMLGKNTIHALSIGYGYGFNAMIKGTIAKIKSEVNANLSVVLTGGNTLILQPYFDFPYYYEPQMLFLGLLNIVKHFSI